MPQHETPPAALAVPIVIYRDRVSEWLDAAGDPPLDGTTPHVAKQAQRPGHGESEADDRMLSLRSGSR